MALSPKEVNLLSDQFSPFFVTYIFENPSESHPLAKIEVTAFSPKKVKSSDFDQSGTIQMMKHNSRRKFLFFIVGNDVQIGHKQRQDTHIELRRHVRGRTCNFSQNAVCLLARLRVQICLQLQLPNVFL